MTQPSLMYVGLLKDVLEHAGQLLLMLITLDKVLMSHMTLRDHCSVYQHTITKAIHDTAKFNVCGIVKGCVGACRPAVANVPHPRSSDHESHDLAGPLQCLPAHHH